MSEHTDIESPVKASKSSFWKQWRLHTAKGRQVWHFEFPEHVQSAAAQKAYLHEMDLAFRFNKSQNANASDLVHRSAKSNHLSADSASGNSLSEKSRHAFEKGTEFYLGLQENDGNWAGDYGGPHFLLPGIVVAAYVTENPFPDAHSTLIKRYMLNHQNVDGGWGLHIEDNSTMFGTVMQYVALRLLGCGAELPEMEKARNWIMANGGAVSVPSWGKFYLSVLGAFEYEGCNTLIPELWLLPRWLKLHPGNYWCHTRMVYLPMSYCYGNRVKGKLTDLVKAIRAEIYTEPYEKINWKKHRFNVHQTDSYVKPARLLKLVYGLLNVYEKIHLKKLRKKAIRYTWEYIHAEDEHTNYINIGPVNQAINSIAVWHEKGPQSTEFQKHLERWNDYLWVAEDGMKMNGYNGSQLWDTAFAAQAMLEGGAEKRFPENLKKAYDFIDDSQVKEEVRCHSYFFRHDSLGGWPFSTAEHGWPITDCTAEGVSSAIAFHEAGIGNHSISFDRLSQAVDLILSFQNANGGWASYEKQRAGKWLEFMNPAEVFGDIMADYPYTECSSACIRSLCEFRQHYPDYRRAEIDASIKKGIRFIQSKQLPDGSWLGSWAVCFTYGTWFALTALAAAGEADGKEAKRGCEFLLSKQNADGSWGESFQSSVKKEYIPHREGQVINTAWALLALMVCRYPDRKAIDKGIEFLLSKQTDQGDWPQQGISGVFNFNCMITYTAYRNVFPIWALARYGKFYRE